MNKQNPSIKLSPETIIELRKEKIIERETDDEVVKRILVSYRKIDWEAEL